jgi:hypothetical protein
MPHTNLIKLFFIEANKYPRVCFALDRMVKQPSGLLSCSNFYDSIHVDEKWFFLTEENMRCYTTTNEQERGDEIIPK